MVMLKKFLSVFAVLFLIQSVGICAEITKTKENIINEQKQKTLISMDKIIGEVIETAGGKEAFDRLKHLSFVIYVMENRKRAFYGEYDWNLKTGEMKISFKIKKDAYNVRFKIKSHDTRKLLREYETDSIMVKIPVAGIYTDGLVQKNNQEIKGKQAKSILRNTYNRAIFDTFWLLAPLMLKDPEIKLDDKGEKSIAGKKYRVIDLTYNHPAKLPLHNFKLYIDSKKKEIAFWKVKLKNSPELFFNWQKYQQVGPLRLSLFKIEKQQSMLVWFAKVKAE